MHLGKPVDYGGSSAPVRTSPAACRQLLHRPGLLEAGDRLRPQPRRRSRTRPGLEPSAKNVRFVEEHAAELTAFQKEWEALEGGK